MLSLAIPNLWKDLTADKCSCKPLVLLYQMCSPFQNSVPAEVYWLKRLLSTHKVFTEGLGMTWGLCKSKVTL